VLRSIPPHLLALVVLLIFILWVILVHHFRRNMTVHKFLAETMGEDTPEHALSEFELAKARLTQHLQQSKLDSELRRRIEVALGLAAAADPIEPGSQRLF